MRDIFYNLAIIVWLILVIYDDINGDIERATFDAVVLCAIILLGMYGKRDRK